MKQSGPEKRISESETERAVTELGFVGSYMGTDFDMSLNDPALNPFYEGLTGLGVPLSIHPAPASIDGPAGDKNFQQFATRRRPPTAEKPMKIVAGDSGKI